MPIWDCDNPYHWDPQAKAKQFSQRVYRCDYGQYCSPRRCSADVYYGAGLTWNVKRVHAGKYIQCTTSAFGCDPLPLVPKHCLVVGDSCVNDDFNAQSEPLHSEPVMPSSSLYQLDLYLVPIIAFMMLIMCCLQFRMLKRFKRTNARYEVAKDVDLYDSDVNLDEEAIPIQS